MPRHAIKNAAGLFYSGSDVPETIYVSRKDNPTVADPKSLLKPVFGSVTATQAIKYDTAQDASEMLNHGDLQDPAAFSGCEVVEVEFDPSDPGASRALPAQ
jgi:hypothetical protein